jgi:monofunctional biosynthetic peptidoglycan transglycosylase
LAKLTPKAEDRILTRQTKKRGGRSKRTKSRSKSAGPGLWRRVRRYVLIALVLLIAAPVALTALYRVVPPPVTPLMIIRLFEGESLNKHWTPITRISPHLIRSVVGLEDSRFCAHGGIDWDAISEAVTDHLHGEKLRGASTISMQTAKNLFLWPDRAFLRKILEAPMTYMIEMILGKRRILEIYLNVVEMGPGIYGAEAAARAYYKRPANALTPWQAGTIAAILPAPRKWSPVHPTDFIAARARTAMARSKVLHGSLRCTGLAL